MQRPAPPASPEPGTLGSPVALWCGVLLSLALHGGLLLFSHLLPWNLVELEAIEQDPATFHEVGLYVKPRRKSPERSPSPRQNDSRRPDAPFARPDRATARRSEVPDRPPLKPLLPGPGAKTIGPGPAAPVFGAGGSGIAVLPNALRSSAAGPPTGAGKGQAEFFNISDKGKKIIYVLDRSGSMTHNHALRFAKQRLVRSLNGLTPKHQFQIIFYSDSARELSVDGHTRGLIYATSRNVERIKLKIAAIRPKGGTRHMTALRAALRQKPSPDVIYFLTDADSTLDARELDEIRLLNKAATRIHCVEFGKGEVFSGETNFLKRLAAMTGGKYRYENVERFPER